MPTGFVKWFDPETGRGRVTRHGKEYPIRPGEAERDARAPRARVHFDVERAKGVEWAVNVRLCTGTRMHRLQHRFGDLVGRRSHPVVGDRDASTLAALWLDTLARGDPDATMALYAPDAEIHVDDRVIRGREHILAYLEDAVLATGLSGGPVEALDERTAVAHFERADGERGVTRLRADHGEIIEQWC